MAINDQKDFVVIFDSYASFESPFDLGGGALEEVSGGGNSLCIEPNLLCGPDTLCANLLVCTNPNC